VRRAREKTRKKKLLWEDRVAQSIQSGGRGRSRRYCGGEAKHPTKKEGKKAKPSGGGQTDW